MTILQSIKEAHRADLHNNTEKVVLSIIADSIGEHGECWLDKSTLAEWSHRSESAIWRATANLQRAGLIVIVPLFRPYWNGAQAGNGYILTAVADTPEKVEAAKSVLLARRWRDREDRASAMGGIATPRPLEVSQRSAPSNPDREIGVSGYAASFSEGGEDEQQQPGAPEPTPTMPELYTQPAYAAWRDCFAELTDKQAKFIANALKGYDESELLRVLAAAKAQLEAGKAIAKPAAYVKAALQNAHHRMVDAAEAARHRNQGQRNQAGHRRQAPDWAAVAEETSQAAEADTADYPQSDAGDQVDLEVAAKRQAAEERRQQERAEWQRAEAERKERERIAAERAQIERERQRERSEAQYAERKRREIATEIAACIDNQDAALRIAGDFLLTPMNEHLRQRKLDWLRMQRNKAGQPLTTQQATAILHGGLLDDIKPARVTA